MYVYFVRNTTTSYEDESIVTNLTMDHYLKLIGINSNLKVLRNICIFSRCRNALYFVQISLKLIFEY